MFKTLEKDKSYLENKYHRVDDETFNPFRRFHYHGYEFDSATGMTDEEIHTGLAELMETLKYEKGPIKKAMAVKYVLENTRIDVNESDYFVGVYSLGRLIEKHLIQPNLDNVVLKAEAEADAEGNENARKTGPLWDSGAACAALDFDHTVPDWDSIAELGFAGILKRAEDSYSKLESSGEITEKQKDFYRAIHIEYDAIISFVDRLYQYSLTRNFEKASVISQCLKNLRDGAPQNTYDMLQLIYIYFIISECIDFYQVRSLGYGLDATLYPFYKRDIEDGVFTKEEIREFLGYFLIQFSAIGNYWNQPMYLAGTNIDGSTKVNELSYLILDVYDELGLYNPKIQIKISKKTPKEFVYKVLDMIRSGITSFVFVNEDIIIKALMKKGISYENAVDSVISGCYEYMSKGSGIGISAIEFNALKPITLVFNNGFDNITKKQIGLKTGDVTRFETFQEVYDAYIAQYKYIVESTLDGVRYFEKYVQDVNPSMIFSATVPKCVETMTDALDSGIKNYSETGVNGLASAVDALMAVYELVFETKQTTLQELKSALDANWEGYEHLRLKALNCKHKYGRGDKMADFYFNAIHQTHSGILSNMTNPHGGKYDYEIHSARFFINQGKVTEATPDGRFFGDETSKNASPAVGADTNGVTALISSATTIDFSLADLGACLDIMLHPSVVQGEDGLDVLYGVLNTYIAKGGASIQFNIFNTEMLRDAQQSPEKYKNLQVRVCGWNVLWNNMSKVEQDSYIKRAENIQ